MAELEGSIARFRVALLALLLGAGAARAAEPSAMPSWFYAILTQPSCPCPFWALFPSTQRAVQARQEGQDVCRDYAQSWLEDRELVRPGGLNPFVAPEPELPGLIRLYNVWQMRISPAQRPAEFAQASDESGHKHSWVSLKEFRAVPPVRLCLEGWDKAQLLRSPKNLGALVLDSTNGEAWVAVTGPDSSVLLDLVRLDSTGLEASTVEWNEAGDAGTLSVRGKAKLTVDWRKKRVDLRTPTRQETRWRKQLVGYRLQAPGWGAR